MTDSNKALADKFTAIADKFMANSGQGHYKMDRQGKTLDLAWYEDGTQFYLTIEITEQSNSRTVSGQISAENHGEELRGFVLDALNG